MWGCWDSGWSWVSVGSCVGVGGVGSFWRGWPLVGGFILRGLVGHRGSCVFRFGFLLMDIFSEESVFRFEYFGAWVFVGVFLGGAAVGGCFGGAVVGWRCCWWLQVMHCQWWVAVAIGDCRCRGFGVTTLGLVEYPDLGRQN